MISDAEVWQTNTVRRPFPLAMLSSQRASSREISVKPLPRVATVSAWLACTISAMGQAHHRPCIHKPSQSSISPRSSVNTRAMVIPRDAVDKG
jgi:hypothetical protein